MALSVKYQHKRLSKGKNIRVLTLDPAQNLDAPVHCSLREQCMEGLGSGAGQYEALSYVWGSPTGDQPVICEGKTLFVTPNCLEALRYLRHTNKTRVLFVDAICIDQNSDDEKIHQVQLMGDVYRFARQVILWLGAGDPVAETYMRRLSRIGNALTFERRFLSSGSSLIKAVFRLLHLGSLPSRRGNHKPVWMRSFKDIYSSTEWRMPSLYECFNRVWTLQELLLAHKVVITYGSQQLGFDQWMLAFFDCLIFTQSADEIRQLQSNIILKMAFKLPRQLDQWKNQYTPRHPILKALTELLFIEAFEVKWKDDICRLVHALFVATCVRSATQPLDHVYGLYGILTIIPGFKMSTPDYSRHPAQVFEEYVASSIHVTRSLLSFRRADLVFNNPGWPSWVPDLSQKYEPEHRGDCSCEESLEGSYIKSKIPKFRQNFDFFHSAGVIQLECVILGTTHAFHTRKPTEVLTKRTAIEALHLLEWLRMLLNKSNELTACPDGCSAKFAFYSLLYIYGEMTLQQMIEDENILCQLLQLIDQNREQIVSFGDQEYYEESHSAMAALLEAVRNFVGLYPRGDGMLPFTMLNGCVGMAYIDEFHDGDLVALFYGLDSAMIIRPEGKNYRLLGRAKMAGLEGGLLPLREDRDDVTMITLV